MRISSRSLGQTKTIRVVQAVDASRLPGLRIQMVVLRHPSVCCADGQLAALPVFLSCHLD